MPPETNRPASIGPVASVPSKYSSAIVTLAPQLGMSPTNADKNEAITGFWPKNDAITSDPRPSMMRPKTSVITKMNTET